MGILFGLWQELENWCLGGESVASSESHRLPVLALRSQVL